jgi:hypothetical protein
MVNVTTGVAAINGEGILFDGETSYLALGSSGSNPFQFDSDFSQILVIKPEQSEERMALFDYGIQTADVSYYNYGYRIHLINGTEISIRVEQAVDFNTSAGTINRGVWDTGVEIVPEKWNAIILRRSSTRAEVRRVTEDGVDDSAVLTYSGSSFGSWRSANYVFIGAEDHATGEAPTDHFKGVMSEFVLFDRYLTDAEVDLYATTQGAFVSRP